ncbi:MAG: hypothetical protein N4P89_00490 [Candidatus Lightella neohaematopini]|nr:hypothetical protein [Candidatus Lightella neohaematopini]MCV2528755.1 hypothetical protein [Candidatus Lightella neohaematopini]
MTNKNIRIAITGAAGRMGKSIIKLILQKNNYQVELGAAIVSNYSKYNNIDVSNLIYLSKPVGLLTTNDISLVSDKFDVLIDFTNSSSSIDNIKKCCKYNKNIVVGTTGFSEEQIDIIKKKVKLLVLYYLKILVLV